MNYNYNGLKHKYFDKESNHLKKLRKKLYKVLINVYDSPNNKKYEKLANINDKIIDFYKKVNNDTKGYETFNVVTDDGNSIYSPPFEELATDKGQVFISEDKIEEIVNRIIDQRLRPSINNNKNGN